MKTLLLVLVVLATSVSAQGTLNAPNGYRFPKPTDFSDDWQAFRKNIPEPFVVRADFNGDGIGDQVWLLPANTGGFGLFAFLGSSDGSHRIVQLERDTKSRAQWYGVSLAKPGRHRTACGKGYWDCKGGEPGVLTLKWPAIEFFKFESASSIFWWDEDAAQFRRTWISD